MINVTPDIIKALQQTGLKVYDEGFLTKDTKYYPKSKLD